MCACGVRSLPGHWAQRSYGTPCPPMLLGVWQEPPHPTGGFPAPDCRCGSPPEPALCPFWSQCPQDPKGAGTPAPPHWERAPGKVVIPPPCLLPCCARSCRSPPAPLSGAWLTPTSAGPAVHILLSEAFPDSAVHVSSGNTPVKQTLGS